MITNLEIEEFIRQAHRVGDAGLTICSSGNLSWRIGDEVLISGTGSWVPSIPKEKVAICNLATGESVNGVKPSMEHVFHLGVLRERPDMKSNRPTSMLQPRYHATWDVKYPLFHTTVPARPSWQKALSRH